jgi:hypothetical protein
VLWIGVLVQTVDSRFATSEDEEHCGDNRDSRHEENTPTNKAAVTRQSHSKWLGHRMED